MEMKEYMAPEMEVVEIKFSQALLTASDVNNDDDPSSGGGSGDPILNPAD